MSKKPHDVASLLKPDMTSIKSNHIMMFKSNTQSKYSSPSETVLTKTVSQATCNSKLNINDLTHSNAKLDNSTLAITSEQSLQKKENYKQNISKKRCNRFTPLGLCVMVILMIVISYYITNIIAHEGSDIQEIVI